MDKITEKIEYLIEKYPQKIIDFAKYMYRDNPESFEKMLDYPDNAEHISSKRKYEELVERIKWADGAGRGPKWSFEDIKKNSRINFSNVDYTEYDYAYLVNTLYAKCHKYISDPSIYLKFAKCLLEDRDEETKIYRGSYYNNRQNQHGKQDMLGFSMNDNYDQYGYNEEDRRRGRHRSERMEDYEDRRGYNNSQYNGDFFRQR